MGTLTMLQDDGDTSAPQHQPRGSQRDLAKAAEHHGDGAVPLSPRPPWCVILTTVRHVIDASGTSSQGLQRAFEQQCIKEMHDAPRNVWASVLRLCVDQRCALAAINTIQAAFHHGHTRLAWDAAAPLPCACDPDAHCTYVLSRLPVDVTPADQEPLECCRVLRGAAEAAAAVSVTWVPLRLAPLFVAILNNDTAMLATLVHSVGVPLTATCGALNVLEFAARHNRLLAVQWLLSPPPSPQPSMLRLMVTAFAAFSRWVGAPPPPGYRPEVDRALQMQGTISVASMTAVRRAVCIATEWNHAALIVILANASNNAWDVLKQNSLDQTVLHQAARHGRLIAADAIIACLLNQVRTTDGLPPECCSTTVSSTAFDMRRPEAQERFRSVAAFVNHRDSSGCTALHHAVLAAVETERHINAGYAEDVERCKTALAMINLLITRGGADVNVPVAGAWYAVFPHGKDIAGMTALQIAAAFGSASVVRALLPTATAAAPAELPQIAMDKRCTVAPVIAVGVVIGGADEDGKNGELDGQWRRSERETVSDAAAAAVPRGLASFPITTNTVHATPSGGCGCDGFYDPEFVAAVAAFAHYTGTRYHDPTLFAGAVHTAATVAARRLQLLAHGVILLRDAVFDRTSGACSLALLENLIAAGADPFLIDNDEADDDEGLTPLCVLKARITVWRRINVRSYKCLLEEPTQPLFVELNDRAQHNLQNLEETAQRLVAYMRAILLYVAKHGMPRAQLTEAQARNMARWEHRITELDDNARHSNDFDVIDDVSSDAV